MLFPNLKDRLQIEGIMPERALLRLKRAGIGIYNAKKVEKNKILLSVKRKDTEKVFAIYPNVCYNIGAYSPYTVTKMGAVGIGKLLEIAKKRMGLLLGIPLFCGIILYADRFVFSVEFTGSKVYAREAYAALEAGGIEPFKPYDGERVDWICSQLLALDGVEFCSVKKSGHRVQVDIRLGEIEKTDVHKGAFVSKYTGEIVALTVLRGTALKKIGDSVQTGEKIAEDWFSVEEGGQVRVEIIARARIACTYEEEITAESEEEAFANVYLKLGLENADEITQKSVEKTENGSFRVKMAYVVTQTANF